MQWACGLPLCSDQRVQHLGAYNRYYLPLDGVFYTYANETATFFFDGGMGKYPTTGPDWAWFAEATLVLVYYPGAVYSTQSAP